MKHKVLLVLLLGIIISVSASAQKVTMNLKQVKLRKYSLLLHSKLVLR